LRRCPGRKNPRPAAIVRRMPLFSRSDTTGGMLAAVALMLPWLNPVAGGPTPAVTPWLVSAACLASLCLLVAHSDIRWEATIRSSWLLAALISSVLCLLQYFDLSSALNGWINTPSPGVVYGNLRQPNQFATLVNMGLIALVCLALRRNSFQSVDEAWHATRRDMPALWSCVMWCSRCGRSRRNDPHRLPPYPGCVYGSRSLEHRIACDVQ